MKYFMKKAKKNTPKTMDEVSKRYEKFIQRKELNDNGRELFEKTLKKASTPKQRGSK